MTIPSADRVPTDCLVCREIDGRVPVPGGLLVDEPLVAVFQVPPLDGGMVFPGHLLVAPRRHASDFSELGDEEAAAVGVQVARWTRALKTQGPRRVYVSTIGHGADHLHVHLTPRWPGTPEDVPWHHVDNYPKARRADFAELTELVDELRRAAG